MCERDERAFISVPATVLCRSAVRISFVMSSCMREACKALIVYSEACKALFEYKQRKTYVQGTHAMNTLHTHSM